MKMDDESGSVRQMEHHLILAPSITQGSHAELTDERVQCVIGAVEQRIDDRQAIPDRKITRHILGLALHDNLHARFDSSVLQRTYCNRRRRNVERARRSLP